MGAAAIPIITTVASMVAKPLISGLFSGGGGSASAPEVPTFAPPPAAPAAEDPNIQAKKREEQLRRAKAKGLSDTVLTSGLGIEGEPLTEKPTLLGS